MQTVPIADNEQGVFIREGAIIPLLNYKQGRMSLLEAWEDPIELLIYPYVGGGSILFDTAAGELYLDDGESNDYLNGAFS
jgi:alpha-glucosidase (family GH31 glycosyl hydrolase)